ncbi:uncharacterized protein [Linepithema humile]
MRCLACKRNWKILLRKAHNLTPMQKLRNKSKKLQVSNLNHKRREKRLRNKIIKLYNKIKYLKHKCTQCNEKIIEETISKLPQNQQLAVQACFAAAKLKDNRGMRYSNEWVYECILLRIKSAKTYNYLRSHNILTLPSNKTLNRYIKIVKGCYGFQSSTFEILKKKTANMEPNDVRGVLLLDEMKLSKTLYFNRTNLKVEGFVNLDKYTPEEQKKKKGDHALVLMFQPFKGTWVQSLACFLSVGSASASILHKIIMECIILTEQCGLKVDAVVSDGASWNRSMWNIFGVKEECFDRYAGIWFFNVAPTMQILKEANIHHDLNDADGSIKFCKRVNALITAMNSRTPKNSLRPDNKIYKRFFGMMRNCGSNDHPDSQLFIQIYRLISTYSLVKPPKGCNVSTGEIMNVLLNIKDIEDTKEREEQWISQIDTILDRGRNNEILAYAPSILNDHDLHICTTSDYILTYIAGYVARKGNRFSKNIINNKNVICEECLKTLILQPNDVIPERHKLIQIKTKGYLKNPSIALFNLLSILEKGIIEATKCGEINVNTLFEIMELIDEEKNSLSSVVKNINMNLLKILFAFI